VAPRVCRIEMDIEGKQPIEERGLAVEAPLPEPLVAQVQTMPQADPFSGHLFMSRGRRGDLLKALW